MSNKILSTEYNKEILSDVDSSILYDNSFDILILINNGIFSETFI